jgi:hypothetical protein
VAQDAVDAWEPKRGEGIEPGAQLGERRRGDGARAALGAEVGAEGAEQRTHAGGLGTSKARKTPEVELATAE